MDTWIKECERVLCQSTNQRGGFEAYLASLSPTNCGGQCTAIWPAGALAYRCRTCQLTTSSAVCVACFKAGGHEDHDWIQYRSPAGGCCDCGDLSAWRLEGCCPDHQPDRKVVPLEQLLAPQPRDVLEAVLEAALARLTDCLGQCTGARCSPDQRRAAITLCEWLQRFACLGPLRRPMSDLLRRPLQPSRSRADQPQPSQRQQPAQPVAQQEQQRPQPQPQPQPQERPRELRPRQEEHQQLEREVEAVLQEQQLVWQEQEELRQQLQQLQELQEQLQQPSWALVGQEGQPDEAHLQDVQGRIQVQIERLQRMQEQQIRRLQELQRVMRAAGQPAEVPAAAAADREGADDAIAGARGSAPSSSAEGVVAARAAGAAAPGEEAAVQSTGSGDRGTEGVSADASVTPAPAAAADSAAVAPAPRDLPAAAMGATVQSKTASVVPTAELFREQARVIIAKLPSPVEPARPHRQGALGSPFYQDCLLHRWILGLRWLHPEPLHQLTSLLLLLLYDPVFKYDTAVYLMECYAPMLSAIAGLAPAGPAAESARSGSPRHPLCGVLDRVVVQLFNSEDVTVRLVQEQGVLDAHLSVLGYLTGAFVDELGKVSERREEGAAGNGAAADSSWEADAESEARMNAILDGMRRLASGFSTLVHHMPAAHHLLSSRELWAEAFLGRFVRPLQAMLPHRRKVSGDVEERAAFRVPLACSAEYVVTACVAELLTTMAGMRPGAGARSSGGGAPAPAAAGRSAGPGSWAGSGGGSDEQRLRRVELLYGAARAALEACEEWCSDRLARSGAVAVAAAATGPTPASRSGSGSGTAAGAGSTVWRLSVAADLYDGLLAGEVEASPHLPLHRTTAAFLQALLQLEQQGGPTGQLARTRMEQLLSLQASLDEGSAWRPVSRFLLLAHAFLSQIIARRWPRNGYDVSQVELFSLNGRELTDLNVLMTQCWMAAEEPEVVLYDTLSGMGAKPLLSAAGLAAPEGPTRGSAGQEIAAPPASPADLQDPATAAACSEALRWLVSLLRERKAAGLAPRERLRGLLVQWLALRNWTYNQLHDLLPQDLQHQPDIEEVLAEVATYRAASLSQARQYTLRREAWQLFCPAFLHYTPSMRSRAWEAAMAAARAAGGGGEGAVYQAHWQLRRPRHALPTSLEPMQRVLGTAGLWRLVTWVLQAFLSGAPRLPEDTLLAALNLLALQLHRLEDLLDRLPHQGQTETNTNTTAGSGAGTCSGSGASPDCPTQAPDQAEQPWRDPAQLRGVALTGATALAGGSPGARGSAGGAAGIVGLLEALLQSQSLTQQQAATGSGAAAAASSASSPCQPALHLSDEALDCLKWLHPTASRLVQAAKQVGVLRPAADPAPGEVVEQRVESREASPAEVPGGDVAAEGSAEAARRRELARQRQAAMMARLRAQQEAFLRRATGQGAAAADSSDEEEEEDSAEEEEEAGAPRGAQRAAPGGGGQGSDATAAEPARQIGGGSDGSDSGGSDRIRELQSGQESDEESGADADGDFSDDGSPAAAGSAQARRDVATGARQGQAAAASTAAAAAASTAAAAAAAASTASRRHSPLGRWLAVDTPEPECAVCREGPAGLRHGPLAFIAHTAMCGCLGAPLRRPRAWDDDPEAGSITTAAVRAAAAGRLPGCEEPHGGSAGAGGDGDGGDGGFAASPGSDSVYAAPREWLRSWRSQGPSVSEADLGGGLHVHCCGHMMHTVCYARFVAGQLRQYLAGAHFPGSHLVLPEMSEFLCPVCRRLANCIVPAAPFQWKPPAAVPLAAAAARAPRGPRPSGGPGPVSHPIDISDSDLPLARVSHSSAAGGTADDEGGSSSSGSIAGCSRSVTPAAGPLRTSDGGAAAAAPGAASRHEAAEPRTAGAATTGSISNTTQTSIAGSQGPDVRLPVPAAAALPPLGHAAGLGSLQPLMTSLELCVRGAGPDAARGVDVGGGRGAAASAAPPGPGPGPGLGGRGCMYERTFGVYGEVVNIATHQMTREGVNHMSQLERGLEARARLLQIRIAAATSAAAFTASIATAAATATSGTAVAPGTRPAVAAAPGPHEDRTDPAAQPPQPPAPPAPPQPPAPAAPAATAQQQLQPQPETQPQQAGVPVDPPAAGAGQGDGSEAPAVPQAGGSDTADVSRPGVRGRAEDSTAEAGPPAGPASGGGGSGGMAQIDSDADAGPAATSGNAAAHSAPPERPAPGHSSTNGSSFNTSSSRGGGLAVRREVGHPVDVLPPLGALRVLVPREPCLAVTSLRVADATAAWKGVPPHAHIWAALAHNLAHWEAVRRPVGLAAGVLGGSELSGAPGAADRGASAGGSGAGGSAVTGLPAVEAAHWRAIQSLAAMAVCGGARQAGGAGTAAGGAGARLGASAAGAAQQAQEQPLPGRLHRHQPHAQVQPLLEAFHEQLQWLLCELPTLQPASGAPSGAAPQHQHPPGAPQEGQQQQQPQQPQAAQEIHVEQQQYRASEPHAAAAAAAAVGDGAAEGAPSTSAGDSRGSGSVASAQPLSPAPPPRPQPPPPPPPPPAASLDLSYAFLPPLLPEVVIPRLAATLVGPSGPSLRSRGAQPHTSAYVAALSWRRLTEVGDLVADPLLLALELLAAGLSGLSGAALPVPDPVAAAPQGAAPTARASTEASVWLPRSPQQLLRAVLRLVWPIQVVQAALWRADGGLGACSPAVASASTPRTAAAPRRGGRTMLSVRRLLQLYRGALAELGGEQPGPVAAGPQEREEQGQQGSCEAAATPRGGAGRLALGGLSAAVLPLLVRAYALDCALARQPPDAALMAAYSALPLGPAGEPPAAAHTTPRTRSPNSNPPDKLSHHHHHHRHQHHRQHPHRTRPLDATMPATPPPGAATAAASPEAAGAVTHGSAPECPHGAGVVPPGMGGGGAGVAAVSDHRSGACPGQPDDVQGRAGVPQVASTGESAVPVPSASGAAAKAEAEVEAQAAASTAAVAGRLAAALGLSDIATALAEPLLLSRRRAAEFMSAGAQAAAEAAAGEAKPAAAGDAGPAGYGSPFANADVEEAILGCVLLRWCGPRAMALSFGDAATAQRGSATAAAGEAAPAGPAAAAAAAPATTTAGAVAGAAGAADEPVGSVSPVVAVVSPQRQSLPWYRGLPSPPSLIPLPHLFQSLFLHYAETRCPECGTKPENPALCLLTGRFVCNLWRGCAELRGGGLLHAREHCGGTCLLLSLRSTRVMALWGNRLAVCQSPYLDAHGDEDLDLRRGRPLYLDAACYRQLARLWGCAALEFDTQLLHNSRADLVGL